MNIGKYRKVVTILTIVTTIGTLISTAFSVGIRLYLLYKYNISANKASSIGIIGGSDGPTAIFINGIPSTNYITITFALLSVIGITYLIFIKKTQK